MSSSEEDVCPSTFNKHVSVKLERGWEEGGKERGDGGEVEGESECEKACITFLRVRHLYLCNVLLNVL